MTASPHDMELLGFELPEFVRTSWTSDGMREVWAPRIERIKKAWSDIEWRSVLGGIRPCALLPGTTPDQLVELGAVWIENGLANLPVAIHGSGQGGYNRAQRVEYGKPFVFRVAVGSIANLAAFKKAHDDYDDEKIAQLLGYPDCCYRFYKDVWVERGQADTTWPMALGAAQPAEGTRTIEFAGPPEGNILWRWLGVRPVPHLPCSPTCPKTVELGRRLIQIGRDAGHGEEMDWMIEILSWSVEWSALHGIAMIKTPVVKIVTQTDATPHAYTVRRLGDRQPEGAPIGLGFAYRNLNKAIFSESVAFQRGMEQPG